MPYQYRLPLTADDDPYPTYRWLRDEDPAHYSEPEDLWVLTRYDDVAAAFKDWKRWSSARRGNLINDIPARIGKTLGTSDPPHHTFARGLVNKAFTPSTVARLKPTIQTLAQALSVAARTKGAVEFVADLSAPFNAALLGGLFGLPAAEFIQLRHWLDDFFLREKPPAGQEPRQVVAMRELRTYLDRLAQARYAQPQDDLLTAMLLATDEEGRRLSQEQVVVTTMTFLTAGFESTNNLFTNLAYTLAQEPALFATLQQQPGSIPAFVEEGMRYDAAAQGFVRSPTHPVELHGKTIPTGTQVLLHIGAANRDERQFVDPDKFDLQRFAQERQTPRHLGMGQGIHFCVGAALGREMAYTLFQAVLAVSRRWEVDLASAIRVTTPNFRGFARLPLTIG